MHLWDFLGRSFLLFFRTFVGFSFLLGTTVLVFLFSFFFSFLLSVRLGAQEC